jgi:hypothetical protein
MYTSEGIRGKADPKIVIPWDHVRKVHIGGQPVMRHVLTIRPEHGSFMARGVGGVRRRDVGRMLVVDHYPDHQWVDVFAHPGQPVLPRPNPVFAPALPRREEG